MQIPLKDTALVVAQSIISLIRESGITLIEAQAAVSAASAILPTVTDIPFKSGEAACPERSGVVAP